MMQNPASATVKQLSILPVTLFKGAWRLGFGAYIAGMGTPDVAEVQFQADLWSDFAFAGKV